MSRVRFVLTDANGIAPYVPELRRLEGMILAHDPQLAAGREARPAALDVSD